MCFGCNEQSSQQPTPNQKQVLPTKCQHANKESNAKDHSFQRMCKLSFDAELW
jgi:hypothetical protein